MLTSTWLLEPQEKPLKWHFQAGKICSSRWICQSSHNTDGKHQAEVVKLGEE